MPLHWRPVGPEPASTYWQRRAAVAAGLVLLLVLVLVPVLLGGSDEPDTLADAPRPGASTGRQTSAPATPGLTASPSPSTAVCAPTSLEVEPAVAEESYAVGGSPRLSLSVTNTGTTPCMRDLGQAQVELTVTSGSDRIWSSDDCAPGGDSDVVTLAPGEPVVQRVTWDGLRSLPDCAGDKAQAEAGTYRVSGRVGDLRVVEGATFRLTA